jgi:predicted  nucleic acid-binding Zn-ribbon protein
VFTAFPVIPIRTELKWKVNQVKKGAGVGPELLTMNTIKPVNRLTQIEEIDTEPPKETPAIKMAVEEIERIKSGLKETLQKMNEVLKLLGQVQKERKACEREIALFRAKLKEIQRVQL